MKLRVTRTVERWAEERRRQVVYDELSVVVAGAFGSLGLALALFGLIGGQLWVFGVVPTVSLVVLAVAGWRIRRRWGNAAQLAALVDASEHTLGLLQVAMAVEQGRAHGGADLGEMVQERALDLVPELARKVAPDAVIPIWPVVVAMSALLVGGLVSVVAPLVPSPDQMVRTTVDVVDPADELPGQALSPETVAELAELARAIEQISASPGLDPVAADALADAMGHVSEALANADDARSAVVDMARAQRELDRAQKTGIHSDESLAAVPRVDLARGVKAALERGDAAEGRRIAEELTRRTQTSSDLDMWNTGKALQDQLDAADSVFQGMGPAKDAAERAAQAMRSGRRGDALGAMAELLAELGEAAAYQPSDSGKLADLEDQLDQARRDELAAVDAADRRALQAEQRSDEPGEAGDEDVQSASAQDDDSSGDAPVGFGSADADGDGKGPKAGAQGQDAADGGAPSAGTPGDPAGQVDGPRPDADRAEGAPSDDPNRLVAGEGAARDGAQGASGDAGQGAGAPGGTEDSASTAGPGGQGDTEGASSGSGAGQGAGGHGAPPPAPPLAEVDPNSVEADWIASQWSGAPDAMGELVRRAADGDRSSQEWGQVHARYAALAETAARQEAIPLTRRNYIRRYFEAIRTESP